MKKSIFVQILLLIVTQFAVCYGEIRIGILGDRTGGADAGVFDGVVKEMALLRPDIVINVGDLIEGPQPDAGAIHREWDRVLEGLKPIDCPLYYTPGNNDIFDETSAGLYVERTGKQLDYAFTAGDIRFVILDNSRMRSWDELSDQRMQWLREELGKSSKEQRICVVFHKPFWIDNFNEDTPDRLHPLFVEHGVDYVFSGHFHQYTATQRDGVHYVMIGSSGGHIGNNPYRGEYYHFGFLTADDEGLHLAVIQAAAIRAENWLTMDDRAMQDKLEDCLLTISKPVLRAGGKTSVRLSMAPDCGAGKGSYKWNCDGTAWVVSPVSGTFDLNDGPEIVDCAALVRGMRYPVPKLEVTIAPGNREYKMFRVLEPTFQRTVPSDSQPLVIDGQTDEAVWDKCLIVNDFGDQDGGACPTDPIEVRLVHDGERLFIAIDALGKNDTGNVDNETPARDGPVFMKDCIYLVFWSDEIPSRITQFVVNADGGLLDQQGRAPADEMERPDMDQKWNADVELKVVGEDTRWQAEMAIRFQDVGLCCPGTFHFNVLRYQPEKDGLSSWIVPATFNGRDAGLLRLELPLPGKQPAERGSL